MSLTKTPSATGPRPTGKMESLRWAIPSQAEARDPFLALKEAFATFAQTRTEAEALFEKHVYNNPNFTPLDARQHRWILHNHAFLADDLALGFLMLNRPDETASYVQFLDDQIKRIEKTLQEWHGDPEEDSDIPESFKQAMREVAAGQTADLEKDVFAEDAAPEA